MDTSLVVAASEANADVVAVAGMNNVAEGTVADVAAEVVVVATTTSRTTTDPTTSTGVMTGIHEEMIVREAGTNMSKRAITNEGVSTTMTRTGARRRRWTTLRMITAGTRGRRSQERTTKRRTRTEGRSSLEVEDRLTSGTTTGSSSNLSHRDNRSLL